MIQRSAPAFPEALDDDDDDVTWALQTAGVQWKRGALADALEWLHRAVESAVDGGHAIRGREIQQQINTLEAALRTGWRPGIPVPSPNVTQRPNIRNPFLDEDDGTEQVPDPYSELPVDIDVEASFELRKSSRIPPHRSVRPIESVPAEDVSDAELIEEVEEFDDADVAALGAGRLPFLSAPTLETSEAEDEYIEPDIEDEDEERPTHPPSVRGLAPLGRPRLPSTPPRPPNLPPLSPSWPPPATSRPPSLPAPPAPAWQQGPPVSSRPPKLPAPPPRVLSSTPATSPSRRAPITSNAPPRTTQPPISVAPPASEAPASQKPRSNRRPSARALALEKKIAAAKALARQRMLQAEAEGDIEEPTERSLEAAYPASSVPSPRRQSSHPPDTEVSSPPPPETFQSTPPDETTERDLEPEPPRYARSSVPPESLPDSEPGTSPDIVSPFARKDSTPPEAPVVEKRESSQPPTESDPSLPPPSSVKVSEPPVAVAKAAPKSEPKAAPKSEPKPAEPRPTDIAGIELGSVPGLEDLPEESQQDLVGAAEIHTLGADEEVSGFGLALVLDGAVSVMPAIADVSAAQAKRGELIFSQGHLEDGVPIRVVAGRDGAKVASFSASSFEAAVRDCPWVGDELKGVGDRLQTLAGVAMGPMGEELDDMLRNLVVERCEVRRLLPNEVIAQGGKPVPGMVIVGGGRIELVDDEKTKAPLEELGPGSFLYASQILQAAPAPHTARAGKEGALVLFAERKVAHELMVSVPPLLNIFAQ